MINSFRLGLFVCSLTATASATEPLANHYFELRLYSVTSNKLGGVLERFRDTVEPVRRKHGIDTVGECFPPISRP